MFERRWSWYNAIANVLLSSGWMIEQHTLRTKRHLDHATNTAVRMKDVCVAGALVTTVASLIADQMMKRKFPEGVRMTATGRVSSDVPAEVEHYWRYGKVMPLLNRAFVAGAVAATPFINFALFNDYRPHPIRRLFTL